MIFIGPPSALAADSFVDLLCDVVGGSLAIIGIALRLWAKGFASGAAATPRLVTSGPYALVRHPVELSNLSFAMGVAILAENALAFTVLTSVYVVVSRVVASWKEDVLRIHSSSRFGQYCRHVPKWIPAVSLSRLRRTDGFEWRRLLQETPVVASAAIGVLIADMRDDLPHLFL
jgi:protein-S-isoprenylcysteine O-methyltransferase Ste14